VDIAGSVLGEVSTDVGATIGEGGLLAGRPIDGAPTDT
jgi:hypothetical protein